MDGRQCTVFGEIRRALSIMSFEKPGETVNTERHGQQIMDMNQVLSEKRPEYQKRQHKVILLHDNAHSETSQEND